MFKEAQYRNFAFSGTLSDDDAGEVLARACAYNEIDEYNTVFMPGCFAVSISQRLGKIPFLWSHNTAEPIGKIKEMWEEPDGLYLRASFAPTEDAQEKRRLALSGAVTGVSVGFIPINTRKAISQDGKPYTQIVEAKLIEVSLVSLPAVDNARILEVRAVPSSVTSDLPLASRDREWDADAAVKRVREWAGGDEIDFDRYRRAFMWYDERNKEEFGSYKLPFCDVIDGKLYAVPRAIFAIAGGHGVESADIPEEDKEKIRRAVNTWYRRMREEFNDDGLVSPFEEKEMQAVESDRNVTVAKHDTVALEDIFNSLKALEERVTALEAVLQRDVNGDEEMHHDVAVEEAPSGETRRIEGDVFGRASDVIDRALSVIEKYYHYRR